MKWEKYKLLTPEQKEEYNYKFRHKPIIFSINGLVYTIVILTNALTFLFFSLYLNLKEKILDAKQTQLILTSYAPILQIIVLSILIFAVIGTIQVIVYGIREHLWKKRNNIGDAELKKKKQTQKILK